MKHPYLRKLGLTALSVFLIINLSAQADSTARKNSLAVNMNGLLAQLFNSNYSNQSFLTYRRHFQKWNLRVGAGGYYQYSTIDGTDPLFFENGSARVNFRAGYERTMISFKRWQCYLGIDAVYGYYQFGNSAPYDTGIVRRRFGHTTSLGVSPVIGINYQFNQLIGLGIETSYDVLLESGSTTTDYQFNGVVYNSETELNSGVYSNHAAPLRLNLRVCF